MYRALITLFLLVMFVGSTLAQRPTKGVGPINQFAEDTAINPHDFSDDYYLMNGINPKGIIQRRTGTDGLSVFGSSSNPNHSNIRVTVTVPAYDQNGDMHYWYPLGELQDYGFTDNKAGVIARELALRFPIYIFPDSKIADYRTFARNRQAALLDNSWSGTNGKDANPIGIRSVVVVNFNEKAFSKEAIELMQYLAKKNGRATDNTPIIRTMDDLALLAKYDLVDMELAPPTQARFALTPVIFDPTQGAIAWDAFLWMATKDDRHLPDEDHFVWQFHCLQKTGNWCP
jgi:hypothetical protein